MDQRIGGEELGNGPCAETDLAKVIAQIGQPCRPPVPSREPAHVFGVPRIQKDKQLDLVAVLAKLTGDLISQDPVNTEAVQYVRPRRTSPPDKFYIGSRDFWKAQTIVRSCADGAMA